MGVGCGRRGGGGNDFLMRSGGLTFCWEGVVVVLSVSEPVWTISTYSTLEKDSILGEAADAGGAVPWSLAS